MRISDWSSDVCSSDLLFGFVRNALDALGGQSDRQQPPLEAIVVEGFAKAWGDHDADTASQQCADRMFTRRPAAKIIAREQNGRRAITRLIEHETGLFPAVGAHAPFLEGVTAPARLVAGRP